MGMIDRTKPIWRVRGQLPAPDLRRLTCFVNGETADDAIVAAKAEGMDAVADTYLVKPHDIERWEATVVRPATPAEIRDHARLRRAQDAVVRFCVAQGPHLSDEWKALLVEECGLIIAPGNPYRHPSVPPAAAIPVQTPSKYITDLEGALREAIGALQSVNDGRGVHTSVIVRGRAVLEGSKS